MKPTDELRHDHENILHLLVGVEKIAQQSVSTNAVDERKIQDIIEFSRNFTDGCHHTKEEKVLFQVLQRRGMSKQEGPIAVMLHEHDQGRSLVRELDEALRELRSGNPGVTQRIGATLRTYAQLLRAHIAKETDVLFPMTDRIFTSEDQQEVEASFKRIEEQEVGFGTHEKYHQMAHDIGSF